MRYMLCLLLLCPAFAFPVALFAAPMPDYARPTLLEDDDPEESLETWLFEGETSLDTGRYPAARLDFRKVLREEPSHQAAARGLAEVYIRTGEYRMAGRALEQCIAAVAREDKEVEPVTHVALARLLYLRGEYSKVLEIAEMLIERSKAPQAGPVWRLAALDGWLLIGNVRRMRGLYEEAGKAYLEVRTLALAMRQGPLRITDRNARQPALADLWCSVGEAYFHLNRLHEANEAWSNALDLDEVHPRVNEWMARLFLEQNHDSSSRVNYSEPTLRYNPNLAGVRLWLAQAHFFRWRQAMGMRQLNDALRVNPNHPGALVARAIRYLYTDQYDEAKADYEAALAVNPHDIEALGAKALHGKMLALDDVYAEAEEAMLAINPNPARFYEIIADGLADRFRYVEALPIYEKAIEANPRHWTAYRGRGMAAMNHGDDVLGKKMLEFALEHDPLRNNLQTVNLLTLLDSYRHFERIETQDGRWRLLVHRSEAPVMADYYLDHLNWAWEDMVKKYDFTPRTPITVEAFHRHEDFEVRTIGITGLPALGACFGQLITLDGPSARPTGSYNWASTLRHEMDHVFQLQLSNGQLPRWLAEGLSVYEEKSTRPEWERHMEDRLFMHYHMDDIPSIRTFNEWFRDGSRIIFAYYLGNVMVEFIDRHLGGLSMMRRMLEMFGEKKTPDEVFQICLNMAPEEFDRRFREYVRDERIAHLRMVHRLSPRQLEQLYFKYEDGEADVHDLVRLALGHLQQGSRIDAETFLGLARRRGAADLESQTGALYHYTMSHFVRGDDTRPSAERTSLAQRHLVTAVERGLEDFQTYMTLAQTAGRRGDMEEALRWLREARISWPENSQPYTAKFQMFQRMGDNERATQAAEGWVRVNDTNLQVRQWLIEQVYEPAGNWERVADMAVQMLHVAPLERSLHERKAYALRRLERYQDAVTHFEYARRLASGATAAEIQAQQVALLLDIAATWMQAGEADKCRETLARVRELDPDNPRIQGIEDQLE